MTPEVLAQTARVADAAVRLPTLFDLTDELLHVLAVLDNGIVEGDEVLGPDEYAEQLAALEKTLAQKLEGYVSVIRSLEAMRDARKAEADRLRTRAARADTAVTWLKERLKTHMLLTGQQRVETRLHTITLVKNPPKVEVIEEMMIPPEYKRVVVTSTVDKKAITEHWKQTGEIIDGVTVTRGESVRFS